MNFKYNIQYYKFIERRHKIIIVCGLKKSQPSSNQYNTIYTTVM